MSNQTISEKDFRKLTPCGARVIELLFERLPELRTTGILRLGYSKPEDKVELDFSAPSPSGDLQLWIETNPSGASLRLAQKGKRGFATVNFLMHTVNFHRTAEALVDFLEGVALGHVIVARTKKRVFPLIGHKRLRFYNVGEIVGQKASEIEQVLVWKKLNTDRVLRPGKQ